jgi:hypothetical protein
MFYVLYLFIQGITALAVVAVFAIGIIAILLAVATTKFFKRHKDAPTTLEQDLREHLANFTYESSIGRGERGLMQHHIDYLTEHLLPFIKERQR